MEKDTVAVLSFLRRHGLRETEEIFRREAGEEILQTVKDAEYAMESGSFINTTLGEEASENESIIHNINKQKVHYGLPKEPDLISSIPSDFFSDEEEDTEDEDREKPNKKRKVLKKDFFARRFKSDPNAPPASRIPFPPLSNLEKEDKINGWKDAFKSARLGPDRLPSICALTLMNSDPLMCSASMSDDSSLLATGYSDSKIRIHSLNQSKLRLLKSSGELQEMDPEAEQIHDKIMDNATACRERVLHSAHAGSIFATSFTPDRRFLIAGCADGSLRLWNLWLWSNLVTYKCHMYPVTDVEFSPMGYYFASAGADRVGRIWATEHITPLRLLVGHNDDITNIHFHPNANYVATSSFDKTVRIWDVATGNCVRYFTGHKDVPQSLCFSRCGKYLASGGRNGTIHLWDVAMAKEVLELNFHTKPVYTMSFSRENTVLASGGHDGNVALWNFRSLSDQYQADNVSFGSTESSSYLIKSYPTKRTTLLNLHFTRRNILLAVGKHGET